MTFVLDVSMAAIERPSKLDLAPIVAAMLWPSDPQMRARWVRAARLEEGIPLLDVLPEALLRSFAKELAAALIDPPARMADLQPLAERLQIDGVIAGRAVGDAMALVIHDPGSANMGAIREKIASDVRGHHKIQAKTMAQPAGPIQRFRSVAHLWASYVLLSDGLAFPCRPASLGRFLAVGEAIRAAAEATKFPRTRHSIMKPGDAVRLPEAVLAVLPAARLEIARAA